MAAGGCQEGRPSALRALLAEGLGSALALLLALALALALGSLLGAALALTALGSLLALLLLLPAAAAAAPPSPPPPPPPALGELLRLAALLGRLVRLELKERDTAERVAVAVEQAVALGLAEPLWGEALPCALLLLLALRDSLLLPLALGLARALLEEEALPLLLLLLL